ncbi:proton myo-inositol cotransporter-like [Saccostrea echinata]|uniref:proton myo-inositol cotransporter-like n=1 Tax=Saccostrea echinata TaxID=191078 RepID=UPI002A8175A4|nr:proton myo-inositol cotransporter-like [Saccostrea echinata]
MSTDTDSEDIELFNMTSEKRPLVPEGSVVYETVDSTTHVQNGHTPGETPGTPKFIYILSFFAAIGGFLFGYDTGVVSGAMLLLQPEFKLDSVWEEMVVSATILFACIFALVGGPLNDRFGRKAVTVTASLVFTGGAVLLGVAQNKIMLLIGRSILGVGIGLASMTVPVYIAECAPIHQRGRLVTINNLFITGGQFVASVLDGAFSYDKKNGWRWMLGLAAVPSAIQFIGFLFLPESPRWLIKQGRINEGREVLQKCRGTIDVEEELNAVRESCEENRRMMDDAGSENVFLKILRTPAVRRAVLVGSGLQLIQQVSGINTVMYYSATIIKMTGVRDTSLAIWLAAVTAGVNFIFTILGVWLVERIGRRPLILGSLLGVLVSLVVLAVGFQLAAFHSPPVTFTESNGSCSSYSWCEDCTENKHCGFCYVELGKSRVNGSCVAVATNLTDGAAWGRCDSDSLPPNLVWASDYCPTDYSWMGLLGLVLYLMFFAPGMGPMPWTINSEIYPLWARSMGNAISTATNWIFNLAVAMTFLTLTESITKYGTYWLFVGIVFCGFLFIVAALPETKGKSLEEVETLFQGSVCPGFSRKLHKTQNST